MVILFMDDERQSSGTMFIPDSPYFIDLFLWHGDDKTRHPYVGSYFKKVDVMSAPIGPLSVNW